MNCFGGRAVEPSPVVWCRDCASSSIRRGNRVAGCTYARRRARGHEVVNGFICLCELMHTECLRRGWLCVSVGIRNGRITLLSGREWLCIHKHLRGEGSCFCAVAFWEFVSDVYITDYFFHLSCVQC